MRIGVISDIHIDEQFSEMEFELVLSQCINESDVDVILIAGDISEYYLRSLGFIKRLKTRIQAKLYFCPGNHDLWSKFETGILVDDVLEYMSGEKGEKGFLQNEAVLLSDETVLIAGCGWYDYSFAFPEMFTNEELKKKSYMERWWKDGKYAKHGKSDQAVDRLWNEKLLYLVKQHSNYNVIFMTHMVNHPAFLVGEKHEKYEMFQYFNGFLGSQGLYDITKEPNVKYSISGHVHYRKSFTENGTYYMCRCLGYPAEYPAFGGAQNLKAQVNDAIEIITVV